jgi:hypothetical protein
VGGGGGVSAALSRQALYGKEVNKKSENDKRGCGGGGAAGEGHPLCKREGERSSAGEAKLETTKSKSKNEEKEP